MLHVLKTKILNCASMRARCCPGQFLLTTRFQSSRCMYQHTHVQPQTRGKRVCSTAVGCRSNLRCGFCGTRTAGGQRHPSCASRMRSHLHPSLALHGSGHREPRTRDTRPTTPATVSSDPDGGSMGVDGCGSMPAMNAACPTQDGGGQASPAWEAHAHVSAPPLGPEHSYSLVASASCRSPSLAAAGPWRVVCLQQVVAHQQEAASEPVTVRARAASKQGGASMSPEAPSPGPTQTAATDLQASSITGPSLHCRCP